MDSGNPKRPWEQKIQQAAANLEDEVRRVVTYINDDVVPEVRQNSTVALRAAAAELERLARRMDDRPISGNGAQAGPKTP